MGDASTTVPTGTGDGCSVTAVGASTDGTGVVTGPVDGSTAMSPGTVDGAPSLTAFSPDALDVVSWERSNRLTRTTVKVIATAKNTSNTQNKTRSRVFRPVGDLVDTSKPGVFKLAFSRFSKTDGPFLVSLES